MEPNILLFTLVQKKLRTNKLELAPGLNVKKAVIFAISPKLEFEMDYTGKYGVGPNTFYIPFNTVFQGRKLNAFLKSDHYRHWSCERGH